MNRQAKLSILVALIILAATAVFAQTHQHGSMPAGDGEFNPFVAADGRGGFYLAFIQRSNGKILVAWDDNDKGPVTFFGILDPRSGLRRRSPAHERLSFPTLAANKELAVIAGLSGSEVRIITERVASEPPPRE